MAFLAGWTYRQPVTIDSSTKGLSGNLTDLTVAVRVPSSNTGFWAGVKADGTDIRFTASDGTTLLKFEIEKFDSTGDDAVFHVKVPSLLSASNTAIYLYYGNASATTGEDVNNTWDSNYKAVWHLSQNKAAGAFADSTVNANNGANSGTVDAAGKIDRAREISAQSPLKYISLGDANSLSFTDGAGADLPFSIEAWVYMVDATRFRIFTKGNNANTAYEWGFYVTGADTLVLQLYINNSLSNTIGKRLTSAVTADEGQWVFYGASYDGSELSSGIIVYRNDTAPALTDNNGGTYTGMTNTVEAALLGSFMGVTDGTPSGTGYLDETAVSSGVRSADYFKARYHSGVGTWLSFGAQETGGAAITDTGAGTDAITITGGDGKLIGDTGAGDDSVITIVALVSVADAGAGADTAVKSDGSVQTSADTGSGADNLGISVYVTVSDTGAGIDAPVIDMAQQLLLGVVNFPSSQTVEYQLRNANGAIVQDWTASGVTEAPANGGKSSYGVLIAKFAEGFVHWRIPNTSYHAEEVINVYDSNADVPSSTRLSSAGFTAGSGATLEQIEGSTVLAKEATVASRLASADYTAPDNAGIAAILSLIQSLDKWKNNKLKRTAVNGSVETWVLYDDDGSTPMLTWTHDTATMTRNKAT